MLEYLTISLHLLWIFVTVRTSTRRKRSYFWRNSNGELIPSLNILMGKIGSWDIWLGLILNLPNSFITLKESIPASTSYYMNKVLHPIDNALTICHELRVTTRGLMQLNGLSSPHLLNGMGKKLIDVFLVHVIIVNYLTILI